MNEMNFLFPAFFADVFKHAFAREIWGSQTLPKIHVYGFSKASNPEAEYSDVSNPSCGCNSSSSYLNEEIKVSLRHFKAVKSRCAGML